MSIGINGFKTTEHSIVVESPSLVSRERKEKAKRQETFGDGGCSQPCLWWHFHGYFIYM